MKIPQIGTKWQHKSGTIYEVVIIANEKATKVEYPITVVYKDEKGNIWSRTLDKWQEMKEL